MFIDEVNIYDPKADLLSLRKKVEFLSQKLYSRKEKPTTAFVQGVGDGI